MKKNGRPRKITDEKKLRLADFIRAGLTIKDSCYGVGISSSTFNRERERDAEFNKLVVEATESGWTNAEALAKYHYRGYKRKNPIRLSPLLEKPSESPLNASQSHSAATMANASGMFLGLPVRFTYPTERPSEFYVNGNNGQVERFTREGVMQTMSPDVYERKYLRRDEPPFLGCVF